MIRARAVGVLFPNMHDDSIPELIAHRTMASVPFAGRYRMIDFCLSGMANAGVQNIGIIVRQNYQSLMDHLGTGREWDLSSKRGGLTIFPPYGRESGKVYHGRIEGLNSVLDYLRHRTEELVIMSDCDIACNIDFSDLMTRHLKNGADVTLVYERASIAEAMRRDNSTYSVNDEGNVTGIRINDYKSGTQNISMNVLVIDRELLIRVVQDCMVRGITLLEKEYLSKNLKVLKVCGYEFKGYRSRIYDMQSYFEENLRLLDKRNLEALFPEDKAVYTKVRDEAPARYAIGAKAKCSLVPDGCIIEGEVENCILFRGVQVGKGAKLKNCVIMQGSRILPGAVLENVVTDKDVTVGEGQQLQGAKSFPVYIAKGSVVT